MRTPALLMLLLATLSVATSSSTWGASVELQVPAAEAAMGQTVKIPVLARGAEVLGALQMDVAYDPAVLSPEEVEPGKAFTGLLDFNVREPGRLRIALATTQPLEQGNELLVIRFSVLNGTASTITIEDAKAWEQANSHEMLVSAQPGQFSVKQVSASEPGMIGRLPLIGGIVLVAVAIGLLLRGARRRPAASADVRGHTPETTRKCGQCGGSVGTVHRFCPQCGAAVQQP